jgi:hypothetical protein
MCFEFTLARRKMLSQGPTKLLHRLHPGVYSSSFAARRSRTRLHSAAPPVANISFISSSERPNSCACLMNCTRSTDSDPNVVWKLRKSSDTAEESPAPVVSVRVAKTERQEIAAPVSAVGTIFPREQATVAAKVSAQIKTMALLKNRLVKAGEVIAVLESRDLLAQRNEALAALNQERANERSVTTGTIPQTNAQDLRLCAMHRRRPELHGPPTSAARRWLRLQPGSATEGSKFFDV